MTKNIDIGLLRTLAVSGSYRNEIAARLGVSRTTVRNHATKHGILIVRDTTPTDEGVEWWHESLDHALALRAEGLTLAEIAHRCGTTKNAVAGKLYRLGKCKPGARNDDSEFWVRNTDEMLRLRAAGWSDRRIGRHLGIGHGAVHSRRKTLRNKAARMPRPQITFPPFGQCVFPSLDVPHTTFCGHEVEDISKPYCAAHCKVAYLPPKPADTRLAA